MVQLSIWAVLSWLCALVYSHYWYKYGASKNPKKFGLDTFGVKSTIFMVLQLFFFIWVLGILSGSLRPDEASGGEAAPSVSKPLSLNGMLMLWIFGVFISYVFSVQLLDFVRPLIQYRIATLPILAGIYIFFLVLVTLQIFRPNELSNNIFMLLMFVVFVPIAHLFRRSGLITIFSLIVLMDIYLVWVSQSGIGKPGGNWYVGMFQTSLMQHWPVPIGFRAGGHLIGGGDIFFMAMAVTYARRVYNAWIAVLVGALATAPLLLLPYLHQIWPGVPVAWPYTIFIAPWGLMVALLSWWRDRKTAV